MVKADIDFLPDTEEEELILILVPKSSFEKMVEVASMRGINVSDAVTEALTEYSQRHKES